MKERPILYSAPMVRAKLAGAKTQTRRICKLPSHPAVGGWSCREDGLWIPVATSNATKKQFVTSFPFGAYKCPYGKVGDRIYGKESHRYHDWTEDGDPWIEYASDGAIRLCRVPSESRDRVQDIWEELSDPKRLHDRACDTRWRPSIHMPRWASRILDEIVEVRVERVQEISESDAIAEGVTETFDSAGGCHERTTAKENYAKLWNEINGAGSWESNPWVWVIVTKAVQP